MICRHHCFSAASAVTSILVSSCTLEPPLCFGAGQLETVREVSCLEGQAFWALQADSERTDGAYSFAMLYSLDLEFFDGDPQSPTHLLAFGTGDLGDVPHAFSLRLPKDAPTSVQHNSADETDYYRLMQEGTEIVFRFDQRHSVNWEVRPSNSKVE